MRIIGQNNNSIGTVKPRLFAQPIFGFSCRLFGEISHLLRAAAGEARTQNRSTSELFNHSDLMGLFCQDFARMILDHNNRENQDRLWCRNKWDARLGQDISARRDAQVVVRPAFKSRETRCEGLIYSLHPFLTAGTA